MTKIQGIERLKLSWLMGLLYYNSEVRSSNSFLTRYSNIYLTGEIYSINLSTIRILSEFIVKPEKRISGTKIMGAISIAKLTVFARVPMKMPTKVAIQDTAMTPTMNSKKWLKPLLKLTK